MVARRGHPNPGGSVTWGTEHTMISRTDGRLSSYQISYISYIEQHPGCSIADVDRACRVNRYAGHKWVYAGVSRLIRHGIVDAAKGRGNRYALCVAS
jgi:hypothetical protein